MNKVVVFQTQPNGPVSIVRPVPWARLVSAITVNGVRTEYAPPLPLENVLNIHDQDRYADFRDAVTAGQVAVEWETEDGFCTRICEELTAEFETDTQVQARVATAQNHRDSIPFRRKTGRMIRKVVPDGVPYTIVDASEIPADRKRRMALTLNPQGRPVVDPTKL